jgi:hypothetical protein
MRYELKKENGFPKFCIFADGKDEIGSHHLPTFDDITISLKDEKGDYLVIFLSVNQAKEIIKVMKESIKKVKDKGEVIDIKAQNG